MLDAIFNRFVQDSPVTVMARAMMEKVFAGEHLNKLFERLAEKQYHQEILFSSLVGLMSLVVCGIHKSVNAAYKAKAEDIRVSIRSIYNKLQRVEPQVSRGLVSQTAKQLKEIIEELGAQEQTLLPELPECEVRMLDGTSLGGTDHRLEVLREEAATPLPGKALVVYEPKIDLVSEVFPCEDGYAQERSLLGDVLETVTANQVWVGDRNFCTHDFLVGIVEREAYFVIREHGNFVVRQVSSLKQLGRIETGDVSEQEVEFDYNGQTYRCRRVVVDLDKPTRNGEKQVVVLSNLPAEGEQIVSGITIANLYRKRWSIETLFQIVTENFDGEISTLAYPKAALFSFCMALCAYNVLATVRAAIGSVHGVEEMATKLSDYYLADEIAGTYRGMMVALPPEEWEEFTTLSVPQMAEFLQSCAAQVNLKRFLKNPSTRKKKKPKLKRDPKHPHVSTARLLEAAKQKTSAC